MSFCLSRHSHPSKSEALECNHWLADLQAGKIKSYRVWPHYDLFIDGKRWRRGWKPDFEVIRNDGVKCVAESKGWNRSDDSFKLRLSIFMICYPEIPVYLNRKLLTCNPFKRMVLNLGHNRKKSRVIYEYDRKLKRKVKRKL